MKYRPHEYQTFTTNKITELAASGLFLPMGMGKTVSTLTAINILMYERFEIKRVLVIAPKRVAEDTWSRESEKWDHLQHLKISKILGTPKQRQESLETDADIYTINRENVQWLIDACRKKRHWPFDMLVVDELSSFKSSKAKRFRSLKTILPLVKKVVGLTGTPRPNSLLDLWAQVYILDRGVRLGKTITGFRDRYFNPGRRDGYTVYEWVPKEGAEKAILEKIGDICFSLSAEDYLELPERMDNIIPVKLSDQEKKLYQELEKEQLLELEDECVVAKTAASKVGKLLQIANGAVYTEDKGYHCIHERKLEALEEIMDTTEEPVLVFYSFRHDLERLRERFKKYQPQSLNTSKDIQEWNAGNIRMLLAHPASIGHGLNLQDGGRVIVWFGLTYNLELYLQANARLDRQGQQHNVIIHHLIAEGTVDEEVMAALERKDCSQNFLLEALNARKELYGTG